MLRKKIDLRKVLESLNVPCPACGFSIPPDKIRRIDTRMKCPECGHVFEAKKPANLKT